MILLLWLLKKYCFRNESNRRKVRYAIYEMWREQYYEENIPTAVYGLTVEFIDILKCKQIYSLKEFRALVRHNIGKG